MPEHPTEPKKEIKPEKPIEKKAVRKDRHSAIPLISTVSIALLMLVAVARPRNNLNSERVVPDRKIVSNLNSASVDQAINRNLILSEFQRLNLQGLDPQILIPSTELIDKLNLQIEQGQIEENLVVGLIDLLEDKGAEIQNLETSDDIYAKYEEIQKINTLIEALANQAQLEG